MILARRPLLWCGCCVSIGIIFAYPFVWLSTGLLFLFLMPYFVKTQTDSFVSENLLYPQQTWLTRFGVARFLICLGLLLASIASYRTESINNQMISDQKELDHLFAIDATTTPSAFSSGKRLLLRLDQPAEANWRIESSKNWRIRATILPNQFTITKPIQVRITGYCGEEYRRGEIIEGVFWRLNLEPPAWDGAFDYEKWLFKNSFAGHLYQKKGEPLKRISYSEVFLLSWFDSARKHFIENLLRLLPLDTGDFLVASLYGHRIGLTDELQSQFSRSGIGHVLTISGLHVGLVLIMIWKLFGLFVRDRRYLALLCIAACLIYLGLSGGRSASIRATVMIVVWLSSIVLGRRSDLMNSLGLSAIIILLTDPNALYDLGFQLSYISVIFIARLGGTISSWLENDDLSELFLSKPNKKHFLEQFENKVSDLISLNIVAFLGILPLVVGGFGWVTWCGLLVNMIAIPLMSLVLAGGLLISVFSFLPNSIAYIGAAFAALPADAMILIAHFTDQVSWSALAAIKPPFWAIVVYYTSFVLFFMRNAHSSEKIRYYTRTFFGSVCIFSIILLFIMMLPSRNNKEDTIWIIPIRGSDAAVIELANGKIAAVGEFPHQASMIEEFIRYRRKNMCDVTISFASDLPKMRRVSQNELVSSFRGSRSLFQDYAQLNTVGGNAKLPAIWRVQAGGIAARAADCWTYEYKFHRDKLPYIPNEISVLHLRGKRELKTQLALETPNVFVDFKSDESEKLIDRRDYGVLKLTKSGAVGWRDGKWEKIIFTEMADNMIVQQDGSDNEAE